LSPRRIAAIASATRRWASGETECDIDTSRCRSDDVLRFACIIPAGAGADLVALMEKNATESLLKKKGARGIMMFKCSFLQIDHMFNAAQREV
jgi:hypothetical protein